MSGTILRFVEESNYARGAHAMAQMLKSQRAYDEDEDLQRVVINGVQHLIGSALMEYEELTNKQKASETVQIEFHILEGLARHYKMRMMR